MPTFIIDNDFNELDFPTDSSLKDLFDKVTIEVFNDSLLFAIIETTTIGNKSGLGTTQYIAYKGNNYIEKTIHKEYFEIIHIIDDTEFGSPSKYYDWYKRNKYYYAIGSNNRTEENYTPQGKLNSKVLAPDKKDCADEYITDYETKLMDDGIRTFFTEYVNLLLQKSWFNELPHYFVLVKPFSITDETGLYIPLGNLYLKIGTSKPINIKEYKKYVSLLQAVWFNKFGWKILKEYSNKKISDEYKPEANNNKTLKKKLEEDVLFTVSGVDVTFDILYDRAFDYDNFRKYREKGQYLMRSDDDLFESLTEQDPSLKQNLIEFINSHFSSFSSNDPINFIKCNKDKLKQLNSIDDPGIKYFLQLLSKRRFALMLLYIYGLTEEETHKCITHGDRKTTTSKSVEIYLRENLFIYPGGYDTNKDLLAKRERLFLEKIILKIKKHYPAFTCKIPT